jgi:hypothetical protein
MPYSSRHRYTSRRERLEKHGQKTKMILIFLAIALVILIFQHRIALWDSIRLWFY